jgi:hypothetical protein
MTLSSQVACSMLIKSERAHSSTLTATTYRRAVSYWQRDCTVLAYRDGNEDADGYSGHDSEGSLAVVV